MSLPPEDTTKQSSCMAMADGGKRVLVAQIQIVKGFSRMIRFVLHVKKIAGYV